MVNSNFHIPSVYYSKKIHLFLLNPSWSWEKRDPDGRMHRRRVLPGQHVRGRAGEHGRVRFKLHQACAEWKAAGQSPPMLACACQSTQFCRLVCRFVCNPGGGWIFILQPQTLQLDFLMKILPNYHHLKKTAKGNSTPVRNWDRAPEGTAAPAAQSICTRWHWHIPLNLLLSYTLVLLPNV